MRIKKLLPGTLFLFLCLLCGIGIALFFYQSALQPPAIQIEPRLVGTRDIVIDIGGSLPDLKEGLGVNDAVERVEIDTSAVDTGTAGQYPIIYRYTDVRGKTYEVETTCTVTASESTTMAEGQEKTEGQQKNSGQKKEKEAGQKKNAKETAHTTPPQTGDWDGFPGYAALFLASVFLSLLLILRRCFFR